jgi:hypothetical protein
MRVLKRCYQLSKLDFSQKYYISDYNYKITNKLFNQIIKKYYNTPLIPNIPNPIISPMIDA